MDANGIKRGRQTGRRNIVGFFLLFTFFFVSLTCFASSLHAQNLESLSSKLRSGDVEQEREALFQIRNLRSEEASRIAVSVLKDGNEMVRATAASSVVFLPKTEAVTILLPLLNDRSEFVRREAAFALGEVGDPAAAPRLVRSLTGEKSLEVRSAAAIALGKIGNTTAVGSLSAILNERPTEDSELLRRAAARSLGQIAQIVRSGRGTVITPQNFLPEKQKDINAGQLNPGQAVFFREAAQELIRVLENSNEADDTRREAAYALGAIGDRSAEPVLAKYISSTDVYLAEICKEALLKLCRSVE